VQRKKRPTKHTIDRLVALGWLDGCGWSYDEYALCCSGFRRPLTPAIRHSEESMLSRLDPTGGMMRPKEQVFAMKFADVYPLYIQKAERKNRTKEEVDQTICWLTGYNQAGFQQQIEQGNDFERFFAQAPAMNPNRSQIKGVVCGVRVEEIEDPLMQNIRYLDKLIDELAKGKAMEKILRQSVV
jgi:hypothetical protein